MFHRRPNVACECISSRWAPVHLCCGRPSQEPTPCPISDVRANENVSSVLWNQWVSADAGRSLTNTRPSTKPETSSGGFHQLLKFCLSFMLWDFHWKPELQATCCQSGLSFSVGIYLADRVHSWQLRRDRANCWSLSAVLDHLLGSSHLSAEKGATPCHRGAPEPWRYPRLWLFNAAFAESFILWAPCWY